MPRHSPIHVIDSDIRRRARIAHELMHCNLHAEIYENADEFVRHMPDEGTIFAADERWRNGPGELLEILQSNGRRLPLAMYSPDPSPEHIVRAMLEGALDYLKWPFDPRLLQNAVERLTAAGARMVEQDRRREQALELIEDLSAREYEVLVLLVAGHANKGIAHDLGISPRTVEIHRSNMMRKLNARTTSDAIRMAVHAGLDAAIDLQGIAA